MDPLLTDKFITTKDASALSGYASDYLSRLIREKKIAGTKIGRNWLIKKSSLESFLKEQKKNKTVRALALAQVRTREYSARHSVMVKSHIPKKPIRPVPTAEVSLGYISLQSHLLSISTACMVLVLAGVLAQSPIVPYVTDRVALTTQEAVTGFQLAFGDIPAQVASKVVADTARVMQPRIIHTEYSASPYLAKISEESIHTLLVRDYTAPQTVQLAAQSESSQPLAVSTVVAPRTQNVFAYSYLAIGNAVIAATHAAIQMDVSFAYATAAAVPASAQAVVMAIGTTGATLAALTERVPEAVARTYMQVAAIPAAIAPPIAEAAFTVEYALAIPFVSFTHIVTDRYLALVEHTGRALYTGTDSALVLGVDVLQTPLAFIGLLGDALSRGNFALGTIAQARQAAAVIVSTLDELQKDKSQDTVAPVVTLNGTDPTYVAAGDVFVDLGANAFDATDGDLTSRIQIDGSVNSTTGGIYTRTYMATDAAGNTSTAYRTIVVLSDTTKYR